MRDDPDLHRRLLETIDEMLDGERGRIPHSEIAEHLSEQENEVAERCRELRDKELIKAAVDRHSGGAYAKVLEITDEGHTYLRRLQKKEEEQDEDVAGWLPTREQFLERAKDVDASRQYLWVLGLITSLAYLVYELLT